jgi:hypothetical protein
MASIIAILFVSNVRAADDHTVESFKQIIRNNQLLFDFTIKRVFENIYLQWN